MLSASAKLSPLARRPSRSPVGGGEGSLELVERPTAVVALAGSRERKWCSRWLRQAGFEVVLAADADDALASAEASPPAVLVEDCDLRASDGSSLRSSLRARDGLAALPAVAIGPRDDDERPAGDELTHFVDRPVNWQLVGMLAGALVRERELAGSLTATRERLASTLEELEAARRSIRQARDVDRLTHLPSRSRFEALVDRSVSALEPGARLAVLYLDLDRFKVINELVGRDGGDRVLQQAADRLREGLEASDVLARRGAGVGTAAVGRLSGDEFTVLLTHIAGRRAVRGAASRLLGELGAPFEVGGKEVYLSATIGAAISDAEVRSGELLLQQAELALCEAKRRGGGTVHFYEESLEQPGKRNLDLHRMLRTALGTDELQLHYQPFVEIAQGRVVAAEALLRWSSPELGTVPPDDFLPAVAGTDLMLDIGRWVLRTACHQLCAWEREGLPPIRMAVNVTPCQLRRSDLAAFVGELLSETGIDPQLLELELSERGILRGDSRVRLQLESLSRLGVRLSVDDFGTGQSAIDYLKQFPLDVLKIDRSYVAGLADSERDAGLTVAMVGMAHSLDLAVVAEGVEGVEQMELLRDWGCDQMQGFLFSPAVRAEEFGQMLASGFFPVMTRGSDAREEGWNT